MSKHTPGPWRLSEATPTKTRGIDILTGHNKFAAHVPFHPNYMPEEQATDRANAKLIAAAPDLLEALQEAVLCLADVCTTPDAPVLVNARAAIDKATR